jgi:hypothetical protein
MSINGQQSSPAANTQPEDKQPCDQTSETSGAACKMSEEEIDYNVMGTFPASDPPSWTLGIRIHKQPGRDFEGEQPSVNDPSNQNEPVRQPGSESEVKGE